MSKFLDTLQAKRRAERLKKPTLSKTIVVRVTNEMREQATVAAKRNLKSLNAFVVDAIAQQLLCKP